jgi:hypothetical protein
MADDGFEDRFVVLLDAMMFESPPAAGRLLTLLEERA